MLFYGIIYEVNKHGIYKQRLISEKGINNMKIQIYDKYKKIFVQRQDDERIHKESTFYYKLVKLLNEHKFFSNNHLFRKQMSADGHLVSDNVYYITNKTRNIRIYDSNYALRDVARTFNKGEILDLSYDYIA